MLTKVIRKIYDMTLALAAHKRATWGLAGVSFIESSVFPIPPDVVLIPMCLANRGKAFFYATICTIASVAGGVLGYAIGYFLFETVGKPILEFYGMLEKFGVFQERYNAHGAWIVFGAGLTPFPYKVITIASGVTKMNIAAFMAASVIGRAARFYLVAALIWKFGAPIQVFIEKYLGLLTLLFFALLIGGFVALKYIS